MPLEKEKVKMSNKLSDIYDLPDPLFNNLVSTSSQYPSVYKTYQIKSCDFMFPLDIIPDKYSYIRKLSDGSESVLYLVSDKNENKLIIKKIPKYNHWREELYILNIIRKKNPINLIRLVDFYENYKYAYVITEYSGSYDLSRYVDINSPYNVCRSKKLAKDMIICIKECHDMNIAHLDIKCENFIVKDDHSEQHGEQHGEHNSLVLIDFGHAELLKEDGIIAANSMYGTEDYLCPEGYNKFYSKKSDIWSFGICVCLLLTGSFVFKHSEYLKDRKIYQEKLESFIFRKKEFINDESNDFIRKCLEYDPLDRPSIDDLLKHSFIS